MCTVAQAKVEELSQKLQEMKMKVDELQNQIKCKDEKISTLESSISSVKERCAAKLKVSSHLYVTELVISAICMWAKEMKWLDITATLIHTPGPAYLH